MASPASRRARKSVRARAALAWGLALFACVQIGVHILLWTDPELGEREYGRKLSYLRATLAENPGSPLILMLGSSRMATAFCPDLLPRLPAIGGRTPIAFNFALVGTGPEMSHLVLHRLLAAGIRPTWVLVEYWPPFWSSDRTVEKYRTQMNLGRLDVQGVRLLAGYLWRPEVLYSEWIEAQVAPSYAHRSALLSRFGRAWVVEKAGADHTIRSLDRRGWWSPRTTTDADYDRAVLARMLAHYTPILAKFETRERPDRALRATLDLCHREQIEATVVFLPEGDLFRKCYPPEALTKIDVYLDRLRRDYGVAVIDARDWVAEAAFMDSHHLFPEGAARFTARLGAAMTSPQVVGQADRLRAVH